MPTYDYKCSACGAEMEIFHSMSETKRKCPECGKLKLVKQIGAGAGFLFKGDGFYQTDYRSQSYQDGKKAADSAKSESKSSSSDAKPKKKASGKKKKSD